MIKNVRKYWSKKWVCFPLRWFGAVSDGYVVRPGVFPDGGSKMFTGRGSLSENVRGCRGWGLASEHVSDWLTLSLLSDQIVLLVTGLIVDHF